MKNKSSLTITLFVFTLLSLGYTTYYIFSTFEQLVTYYAGYDITTSTIIFSLLSACYTPMAITVVLYGLTSISDLLNKLLNPVKNKVEDNIEEEKKEAEDVA